MKKSVLTAALITAGMVPATAAHANEPKLLGTHGAWQTYSRFSGENKICYVLAKPKTKAPANVRHGDIYFMVANWKSGAASEQPSFMADFPLKTSQAPVARVGQARFPMYVSQNESFIEEGSAEKRLVKAMRDGATMRIDAVSGRGTNVSYNFSLSGITAALNRAKGACS